MNCKSRVIEQVLPCLFIPRGVVGLDDVLVLHVLVYVLLHLLIFGGLVILLHFHGDVCLVAVDVLLYFDAVLP